MQLSAGCSLLLAVFDVTREESLAAAKTWVATVTEWSGLKTQVLELFNGGLIFSVES